MYKTIFQKAGLSPTQAEILEYLYQKKEEKASEIAKKIKKSRAICYKDLDELVNAGLVERQEKAGQVSFFRLNHPAQMEKFFDEKEKRIKKDRQMFQNYLPDMISSYNLLGNKPGVRYYEGLAGIKKVLADTLTSQEEILSYADIEAIAKYIEDINQEYSQKRARLKIKKRGIIIDSPFARKYLENYHKDITDTRAISHELFPFNAIMQIYDNKIAYITLSEKSMIGVIIEDAHICQMHKALFEFAWNYACPLDQLPALSKAA